MGRTTRLCQESSQQKAGTSETNLQAMRIRATYCCNLRENCQCVRFNFDSMPTSDPRYSSLEPPYGNPLLSVVYVWSQPPRSPVDATNDPFESTSTYLVVCQCARCQWQCGLTSSDENGKSPCQKGFPSDSEPML